MRITGLSDYRVTGAASQRGALFGLDARIALAIFSILSVVAGVAVVGSIDGTRGQVLAGELKETAQALESFHSDVKADIFQSLSAPSGKNAFQALYDNAVIKEEDNMRARWNGPYIKFNNNIHPKFGDMLLTKAGPDHNQPCEPESVCSLYLIYSRVKPAIAMEANKILDGETEKDPDKNGRFQWTADADDNVQVYFRAVKAMTPEMEY